MRQEGKEKVCRAQFRS